MTTQPRSTNPASHPLRSRVPSRIRTAMILSVAAIATSFMGCTDGGSPLGPEAEVSEFGPAASLSSTPATRTITVTPNNADVQPGESFQLSAVERWADGTENPDAVIVWSSADPSIATVNATGLVTGVTAGAATVQATRGGRSGSAVIVVAEPATRTVTVSPYTVSFEEGTVFQMTAVENWASGAENPNAVFTWESADAKVATVNAQGQVTGLGAGTTTITASRTGRTGTAVILVTAKKVVATRIIKATPDAAALEAGSTFQLTAVEYWASGEVNGGAVLVWESTDPKIATVDAKGLVTGIGAGTTTVLASRGGRSGSAAITVTKAASKVTKVSISPESATLESGESMHITTTVLDQYGGTMPGDHVVWTSSDPSVATVVKNGSGAMVSGVAAGAASLRATVDGVNGSSTLKVTFSPKATKVSISPSSASLDSGESLHISATVVDQKGGAMLDRDVVWTSSNTSVASVVGHGLDAIVSGVGAGSATIKAAADGLSGSSELTVTFKPPANVGPVPAFPGAEGWGATALNQCRDKPIQVLAVTNTNTTGAGSLDQALLDVRSDRFTFIVFRTGGRIVPPSGGTQLNASCLYIAGQTAPGDGVVIEGQGTSLWLRGGGGNISDIVMRHLKFRGKGGQTRNNLIIAKGERIVLDHLSLTWADNYVIALIRYGHSTSAPIADVSIQNSLVAEPFSVHPTTFVLNSDAALKDAPFIGMTNISIHRNLIAHGSHRNPMTAADNALIANNVIYNWQNGAGMMNRRGKVDWVNNFAKAGPMTRSGQPFLINPYCNDLGGDFSIYAAGNVSPASSQAFGDNWSGATRQVACFRNSGDHDGQEVPKKWRRGSPMDWAGIPDALQILSAADAFDRVLNDVGANQRLTCDGTMVFGTDKVDSRIISETRTGGGVSSPPSDEKQFGGLPAVGKGTPCKDTDGDGIPDAWEQRYFGSPTGAKASAMGRNGYLMIEHYLNGTTP